MAQGWGRNNAAARRRVFLPILVLVAFLAGCVSMAGLSQKPEVTLAGIDLIEFGLLQQRFALKLLVQNPNEVDLTITGLAFDVELNGQPFAKGVSDKAMTVPRLGEAFLDVAATSDLGRVLKQLRALEKNGRNRIDTLIHGRIDIAGAGSIPFARRGDLQMPLFDRAPRKPLPQGSESL